MTIKEQLISEIEKTSEPILQKVLDFLVLIREQNETKPIWQISQELTSDLDPNVVALLPTDGAVQHDHYIYETPKK